MNTAPTLAQQLLLVDEIMRAGKGMGGGNRMEGWVIYLIVIDVNVLYFKKLFRLNLKFHYIYIRKIILNF